MEGARSLQIRLAALFAFLGAAFVLLLTRGAIPQDAAYYDFADKRAFLGVPYFMDVASNLPFVLVGVGGVWALRHGRARGCLPELRPAAFAFFIGTALIGLGSGYFHWRPDHWTLFWDRAPMTIAFMAFAALVLGEHVGQPHWAKRNLGATLLWPLLGFGLLSVVVWILSEMRGAGDLRFYIMVQFAPMVLLPFILWWFPSAFGSARYYWAVLGLYAVAKGLELADAPVFYWTSGGVSGHSLKHIAAAGATAVVLLALLKRPSPVQGR